MKKLAIISVLLIGFAAFTQESYLSDLFNIEYVCVKSERKAEKIQERLFQFGLEREIIEAEEEGNRIYLIEFSESENIILDTGEELITDRIRKNMITIKYE